MARFLLEDNRRQLATTKLIPREPEMLGLVASGLFQKQITDQLQISPQTVDFNVGQTHKKLGVPNAFSAIAKTYETATLPRTR